MLRFVLPIAIGTPHHCPYSFNKTDLKHLNDKPIKTIIPKILSICPNIIPVELPKSKAEL